MAVKKEDVEKNVVKLTFEVPYADFEKAINNAYRKNAKKFNIPGFRKGHAPKAIIEKYYTESVFYNDAINEVLPDAYEKAVKESELDIVSKPEIDAEDIKKGEPVVFTALVTTKPEVKLGEYKGIEVEQEEVKVTDADIDSELSSQQLKNARLITVENRGIKKGDTAVIDFDGSVDGEPFEGGKADDYELEIGSNTFIPGFEDQLIGAKTNDLVDVNVKFPEDYHAKELAGKDALFKVTVKEIRMRELPELNDDFAQEISEFDTLDAYKKDLKKKLTEAAEEKAKTETENKIIDKVVENSEMDVPDVMVEDRIDSLVKDFEQRLQYQGMDLETYLKYINSTKEALREQFKEQAKKQVNASLTVEAIQKLEGIETGEEELELHLIDMAKKYNMEVEKLKEYLSEAEIAGIKNELAMEKTVKMLANNAKVKVVKAKKAAAAKAEKAAEKVEKAAGKTAKKAKTAQKED